MEGLERKVRIRPVFDGVGVVLSAEDAVGGENAGSCEGEACIFTTLNTKLVRSRLRDGRIVKEIDVGSGITAICRIGGRIVVCTIGNIVYTYDIKRDLLEYLLRENITVKEIEEYNGKAVLGSSEGVLAVVDLEQKEVVYRRALEGSITKIRSREDMGVKRQYKSSRGSVVVGDVLGNVFVVEPENDRISYRDKTHTTAVTVIEVEDEQIYTGSTDGCIILHRIGEKNKVREVGYAITGGAKWNGMVLVVGESRKIEFYTMGKESRADVKHRKRRDGDRGGKDGSRGEDKNGRDVKNDKDDKDANDDGLYLTTPASARSTELSRVGECEVNLPILKSIREEEGRIVLISEEGEISIGRVEGVEYLEEKVVVGNIDQILDIQILEGHVLVSTNSSMVKAIRRECFDGEGEFLCVGEMVAGPNEDCSLSLTGNGKIFVSGTKDGYINGYTMGAKGASLLFSVNSGSPVTALCMHKNRIVSGSGDGVVKGWEIGTTLSLIFAAPVSDSDINGITILGSTIFAATKEKDVKRIDFTGRVMKGLEGHKKGVWSLCSTQDTLVTSSSDKTVRIWREGATTNVLQHSLSVIKALISDRIVTATSEGVIRVWCTEKEKELASLRVADTKESRIWAMKEISQHRYLVGAGDSLVVVQDNTREIERQKEEEKRAEYLVRRHGEGLMQKGRYAEAAAAFFKLDSHREIKEALRRIEAETPIECLILEMKNNEEKAIKSICRWSRSPQLIDISGRIVQEVVKDRWKIPREKTEELSSILLRLAEILNDAY